MVRRMLSPRVDPAWKAVILARWQGGAHGLRPAPLRRADSLGSGKQSQHPLVAEE